jgi:hypothetical protein
MLELKKQPAQRIVANIAELPELLRKADYLSRSKQTLHFARGLFPITIATAALTRLPLADA